MRLTVLFRGREVVHPQIGERLLEEFRAEVSPLISTPPRPVLDGKRMAVTLTPRKRV